MAGTWTTIWSKNGVCKVKIVRLNVNEIWFYHALLSCGWDYLVTWLKKKIVLKFKLRYFKMPPDLFDLSLTAVDPVNVLKFEWLLEMKVCWKSRIWHELKCLPFTSVVKKIFNSLIQISSHVFVIRPRHLVVLSRPCRNNLIIIFVHLNVFLVTSGAELARSLPTMVPESPRVHQPRTPRTPRTPGRQDPSRTPRFYPVMKESSAVDRQVRRQQTQSLFGWSALRQVLCHNIVRHNHIQLMSRCFCGLMLILFSFFLTWSSVWLWGCS